jgi:hypothetical protein
MSAFTDEEMAQFELSRREEREAERRGLEEFSPLRWMNQLQFQTEFRLTRRVPGNIVNIEFDSLYPSITTAASFEDFDGDELNVHVTLPARTRQLIDACLTPAKPNVQQHLRPKPTGKRATEADFGLKTTKRADRERFRSGHRSK